MLLSNFFELPLLGILELDQPLRRCAGLAQGDLRLEAVVTHGLLGLRQLAFGVPQLPDEPTDDDRDDRCNDGIDLDHG